jgi:multiple sugar transport system substrate-binding protein
MRKFVLILAVLVFPALAFAGGSNQKSGGSGSASNYMRLTWWGNTVRDEQTAKAAELFKSKNPGVTIDLETTGWGGYWDKVNTQAASGSVADLMQQDYLYIGQWASRSQLLDLTPYIQNRTIDVSNIPGSVVDSGKIDGKLYGLPLGTTIYCMAVDPRFWRKRGFRKSTPPHGHGRTLNGSPKPFTKRPAFKRRLSVRAMPFPMWKIMCAKAAFPFTRRTEKNLDSAILPF